MVTLARRVLILCTGNAARSRMAGDCCGGMPGPFRGGKRGHKAKRRAPEAIAAMRELGIDISGHRSKHVDEFEGQQFDYVITVCDNARESCPVFLGGARKPHMILKIRRRSLAPRNSDWRSFGASGTSEPTCASSQTAEIRYDGSRRKKADEIGCVHSLGSDGITGGRHAGPPAGSSGGESEYLSIGATASLLLRYRYPLLRFPQYSLFFPCNSGYRRRGRSLSSE